MNHTIQFGLSCNPAKSVENEIEMIAGMGFDFAEITMEAPFGTLQQLQKRRNSIKNALKDSGIFATAHAPLDMNLGSVIDAERDFWISRARKILEFADATGIRKMNFHGGYTSLLIEGVTKKQVMKNNADSIVSLSSPRRACQILLENTHEPLKDFLGVFKDADNLHATIDVGHAFMHGGNMLVAKCIRGVPRISHLHLHDNNGKEDEHMEIGKGKINFPVIGKELKKINFGGTAALEIFTKNRAPAKTSLARLKKMWSL